MTAAFIIASFMTPIRIGATPQSLLWLFPLAVTIAVVYKATKLPTITARDFIREVVVSFGSGIILLIIITYKRIS